MASQGPRVTRERKPSVSYSGPWRMEDLGGEPQLLVEMILQEGHSPLPPPPGEQVVQHITLHTVVP